ncbi:hypothetical protein HK103_001869 [Boothiomyces macroporosus]|uniref:FAM192A/Fyv6 N-terminal domain-containing protein n=1 Tax=Boothiomyces macroporosus TaxID=261099 RepID=A0AAD5UDS3_9FUNG|nr:hypothetical protein HK103_001869 [Boothiomyces macroporosus]
MSAAEHFSSVRKDIKSKFISEANISEADKLPAPEPSKEKWDPRPLHVRIAEAKKKEEDEMNEIFRLANRIRKLDEDEISFYEQIKDAAMRKQTEIKNQENKELEKFRADAESLKTKPVVKSNQNLKRHRDQQKDILSGAVKIKKRKDGKIETPNVKTNPVKSLVGDYPDSDDDV